MLGICVANENEKVHIIFCYTITLIYSFEKSPHLPQFSIEKLVNSCYNLLEKSQESDVHAVSQNRIYH